MENKEAYNIKMPGADKHNGEVKIYFYVGFLELSWRQK